MSVRLAAIFFNHETHERHEIVKPQKNAKFAKRRTQILPLMVHQPMFFGGLWRSRKETE